MGLLFLLSCIMTKTSEPGKGSMVYIIHLAHVASLMHNLWHKEW